MINQSWIKSLDRQARIKVLLSLKADLEEVITSREINIFDDPEMVPGKRPQSRWVRAMCALELRIDRSLAQLRQQPPDQRTAELKGIRVYWRIRKKHALEMEHMLLSVKADCRVQLPGAWVQ